MAKKNPAHLRKASSIAPPNNRGSNHARSSNRRVAHGKRVKLTSGFTYKFDLFAIFALLPTIPATHPKRRYASAHCKLVAAQPPLLNFHCADGDKKYCAA